MSIKTLIENFGGVSIKNKTGGCWWCKHEQKDWRLLANTSRLYKNRLRARPCSNSGMDVDRAKYDDLIPEVDEVKWRAWA